MKPLRGTAKAGGFQLSVKQFMMARGLQGASTLRGKEVAKFLRHSHTIPLSSLAQYVRERLIARLPERLLIRAERKAERERLAPLRRKRKKKPVARKKKVAA